MCYWAKTTCYGNNNPKNNTMKPKNPYGPEAPHLQPIRCLHRAVQGRRWPPPTGPACCRCCAACSSPSCDAARAAWRERWGRGVFMVLGGSLPNPALPHKPCLISPAS